MKEAKPLTILSNDGPAVTLKVKDSAFFRYNIEDTSDLERHFFLLNLSNRKDIAVYIHRKNYPSESEDEHEYALGQVPDKVLKRMFNMHYMREQFQMANPYIFVPDLNQVLYYPTFKHTNLELFKPENKEKLDSDMISKITTWTPSHPLELPFITDLGEDQTFQEPPNRIDLLFEAAMW